MISKKRCQEPFYAFLTTRSLVFVEEYHRPMPVMLTSKEDFVSWLNPDIVEREPQKRLFERCDVGKMVFCPAA